MSVARGARASRRLGLLACLLIAVAGTGGAETLTPQEEFEGWIYDPEGRRDPFVSLLTTGTDLRPTRERPAGLAGLAVNELTLRGLVSLQGTHLAVFEAPDSKTYILRGGERLFDGSVKSVTPDEVVFLAEVSDPLSLVSEREVRRTLAGPEERAR